jgi:hypothetical protein
MWKVTQQITNRLQVFINHCLWCIINMRWPETISNEDLWKITTQKPIAVQMKGRKWHWIGHTLRKPTGSMEKAALDWNPWSSKVQPSQKDLEEGGRGRRHGSGVDME